MTHVSTPKALLMPSKCTSRILARNSVCGSVRSGRVALLRTMKASAESMACMAMTRCSSIVESQPGTSKILQRTLASPSLRVPITTFLRREVLAHLLDRPALLIPRVGHPLQGGATDTVLADSPDFGLALLELVRRLALLSRHRFQGFLEVVLRPEEDSDLQIVAGRRLHLALHHGAATLIGGQQVGLEYGVDEGRFSRLLQTEDDDGVGLLGVELLELLQVYRDLGHVVPWLPAGPAVCATAL